jgi:hypothetical protein
MRLAEAGPRSLHKSLVALTKTSSHMVAQLNLNYAALVKLQFHYVFTRLLASVFLTTAVVVDARTVYHCMRGGSASLSTAPEGGSKCKSITIDDHSAMPFKRSGIRRGTLYRRQVGNRVVYGTRKLSGSVAIQKFDFSAKYSARRASLGKPRLDIYRNAFRRAAAATGTDEAWLRAIAHVESAFRANAVSPKGAMGVMQLMPTTARQYQVSNAFDPRQSIAAGARPLRMLRDSYAGDRVRVAAAYNAGSGAVKRYGGVPPYPETQAYVRKVMQMYARYQTAMGRTGRSPDTMAGSVAQNLSDTLKWRSCTNDRQQRSTSPTSCTTSQHN